VNGTRWDFITHTIGEQHTGELITTMPCIWLHPMEKSKLEKLREIKNNNNHNNNNNNTSKNSLATNRSKSSGFLAIPSMEIQAPFLYACPCYKISTRAGVLSMDKTWDGVVMSI
jgi:hypothetical protein